MLAWYNTQFEIFDQWHFLSFDVYESGIPVVMAFSHRD